jgi:uncharacterized glyoxalase superfamily protein PhnB
MNTKLDDSLVLELPLADARSVTCDVYPSLTYDDAVAGEPRTARGLPQALSLYVADPDEHYARAVAAGATVVRALQDEEYGARGYMVADPEGRLWYFGNYRPGGYW